MSKARLVITAVIVEHRTQAEVARTYGVSEGWVSKLVARYHAEGETAFEPRSRRPKASPNATAPETVELILQLRRELTAQGLDAGPDTIRWHLRHHHQITVSRATISRRQIKAGLVEPAPKKRPKTSYRRFEASMPNETWQADFTHYPLSAPASTTQGPSGPDVEILTWIDDCTRYVVHCSAHPRITGPLVLAGFRKALTQHGIPASTLTDNGMVFTTRFSGGKGGRNGLETELRRLHVVQKNSRGYHPQTCGKVERFQQTMKKWLRRQPAQPATITDLQVLIDAFVTTYNQHRPHRPHRSLRHDATPATLYDTMPKALPGPSRDADTHDRIRHDRVDTSGTVTLRVAGKLRHIGIGRTHARTHVILLVHDLDVRVVNAVTGELLRELTIDLDLDYQPTGRPPGPPPRRPRK
jgi:transposase InsO family protein